MQSRSGPVAYSPMLDGSCRYTSLHPSRIDIRTRTHTYTHCTYMHALFLCSDVDQSHVMWKKSPSSRRLETVTSFWKKVSIACNSNFLKSQLEFGRILNIITRDGECVCAYRWDVCANRYDYLADITWLHFLPFDQGT